MSDIKMPADFDWRSITPEDSPKTPLDIFADEKHVDLSSANLNEGDAAYFFKRPLYDFSEGKRIETGHTFDLEAVSQQKPVALIFGSYT